MNLVMKYLRFFLYFLLIISIIQCDNDPQDNVNKGDVYDVLERVLSERKHSLKVYLNETRKLAQTIHDDENMVSFFKAEREFYYLKKQEKLPQELNIQIDNLHQNIQNHYIMNYQSFYDILFIDNQGEIFYTFLKQKDFGKNIFSGKLAKTKLSKRLRKLPDESFVDFQFYEISGEPSAFFIEPVKQNGKTLGWFVIQCAINKINNLFTVHEDIGLTGEVVLVNKEHYMLTNSRFSVNPTILKQKLPDENIEWKFKKRRGHKNVVDYRGKEVFSVFEVFSFLDSEWLIIAKIDKSEILTQRYLNNEDQFYKILKKSFKANVSSNDPNPYHDAELSKVDMDEFGRNDTCGVIATTGVSTCTAVVITYPGRFTYMAHISPYDVVYNEARTDLLSQVLKQILFFDITESEKQNLKFYLMSTQLKSVQNITRKIVDKGFFLSQISFAYNKNARYGNVYSNCSDNNVYIEWIMKGENSDIFYTNANNMDSFEHILLNNSEIL